MKPEQSASALCTNHVTSTATFRLCARRQGGVRCGQTGASLAPHHVRIVAAAAAASEKSRRHATSAAATNDTVAQQNALLVVVEIVGGGGGRVSGGARGRCEVVERGQLVGAGAGAAVGRRVETVAAASLERLAHHALHIVLAVCRLLLLVVLFDKTLTRV